MALADESCVNFRAELLVLRSDLLLHRGEGVLVHPQVQPERARTWRQGHGQVRKGGTLAFGGSINVLPSNCHLHIRSI